MCAAKPRNAYKKNEELKQFFTGREAKFNREIIRVLALHRDLTAYEITAEVKRSHGSAVNYSTIYRRLRNIRDNAFWWVIKTGEKKGKKNPKSELDTYGLSLTGSLAFLTLDPKEDELDKLAENYPLYLPCWFVCRLVSKGIDKPLAFEYIFKGLAKGLEQRTLSLNMSYDFMLIGVFYSLLLKKRDMMKKGIWDSSLSLTDEDMRQFAIENEPLVEIIDGWDKAVDFLSNEEFLQTYKILHLRD